MTISIWKARRGRDSSSSLSIQYNTHVPWRTTSTIQTNGELHHFSFDTNPVLGHVLVHYFDKTHVLVVTVQLIWLLLLNVLSFNFVPKPNKYLRFTRFRRSYVNCPAVILINHCQSYTAFLLDVNCSKWPRSFFLQLLVPNENTFAQTNFAEHTYCSNIINSKVGKQMKRC